MGNITNEAKLNELLREFRTSDAIVECNSVHEYDTLMTLLENHGYGIKSEDSPSFTESDFKTFPYLVAAPDDRIYSYSDVCIARKVWDDPIHTIHTVTSVTELTELDKAVQQMKDFKNGELMVAVGNDNEYWTLVEYLRRNGMSKSEFVPVLDDVPNLSFYATTSPSTFSAGNTDKIKKYRNISKVITFSDFVPDDTTVTKDIDITEDTIITKDEDLIHVPFVNKDNLMNALRDRFHEDGQVNNITQVNLGDVLAFIKEYEPDVISKETENDYDYDSGEPEL